MGSPSLSESTTQSPERTGRRRVALRFVEPEALRDVCAELTRARFVVARAFPEGSFRGQLRALIEDAVEGALALRGALPPAVAVGTDSARTIADQLCRVRALDARGLAIVLPRLADGAGDAGSLDGEDSSLLFAWLAAAREAPVELLADARDRRITLLAPRALEELAQEPESPEPAIDLEEPSSQMRPRDTEPDHVFHLAEQAPLRPLHREPATVAAAETPVEAPPAPIRAPEPEPPRAVAERVVTAAECRKLAIELDAARGPKPTAAVEKLFVSHYVPLLDAVARGDADHAVREVVDEFRSGFEHSYKEGFATLRVTGRRPPMVFDVPEIAARIGRLNGARKIVLLLVDGMRFDLGERIADRVQRAAAGRAVIVERTLLWAALPANTPTQLGLLARGASGLRDAAPSSDPEPTVERGRGISTLRRERVGSREIMKLDLVEARLRVAGPPAAERLDRIADEVAPILARFVESLPPRTLLLAFGDHGFKFPNVDPSHATGPAQQGGASPEEVLVPGYAWLVDGVH